MSTISELPSSAFEREVLQSASPVLVDFWRPGCVPCQQMKPHLEQIADTYRGRLKVFTCNASEAADIACQFGVQSVPTILLFKNGRPYESLVGFTPRDKILRRVAEIV